MTPGRAQPPLPAGTYAKQPAAGATGTPAQAVVAPNSVSLCGDSWPGPQAMSLEAASGAPDLRTSRLSDSRTPNYPEVRARASGPVQAWR
jgi:hypothetical protein